MEFMLTGVHFSAQRAYEAGMVNKIVPAGQHIDGALEYAEILHDSSPMILGMLERFVRHKILPKEPSEQADIARRDLLAVDRPPEIEPQAR